MGQIDKYRESQLKIGLPEADASRASNCLKPFNSNWLTVGEWVSTSVEW